MTQNFATQLGCVL